jgi:hypothetical protein
VTTRLIDQDLEIRNSALYALLAALGYTPDDGSGATTWAVDKRIKEAVAAGRMVHNSRGHYAITREFYDEMVRKNGAQSRQSA